MSTRAGLERDRGFGDRDCRDCGSRLALAAALDEVGESDRRLGAVESAELSRSGNAFDLGLELEVPRSTGLAEVERASLNLRFEKRQPWRFGECALPGTGLGERLASRGGGRDRCESDHENRSPERDGDVHDGNPGSRRSRARPRAFVRGRTGG